jgi:hypothetical protein
MHVVHRPWETTPQTSNAPGRRRRLGVHHGGQLGVAPHSVCIRVGFSRRFRRGCVGGVRGEAPRRASASPSGDGWTASRVPGPPGSGASSSCERSLDVRGGPLLDRLGSLGPGRRSADASPPERLKVRCDLRGQEARAGPIEGDESSTRPRIGVTHRDERAAQDRRRAGRGPDGADRLSGPRSRSF